MYEELNYITSGIFQEKPHVSEVKKLKDLKFYYQVKRHLLVNGCLFCANYFITDSFYYYMNIYFPQNIFTELVKSSFHDETAEQVRFLPASLISGKLLEDSNSVGLIPTLDLITHSEFFISKSFGISFEDSLCNSYLYFYTHGKGINELYLNGDVSANEVLGAKLVLKELYASDVQIKLLTENNTGKSKDVLSAGDINFKDDIFLNGISFAEEIIEALSLPYVNFVLASAHKNALEDFHRSINDVQTKAYNLVEQGEFGRNFSEKAKQVIKENISSFICNLDEQDIDGIDQLLRLPFYHEIISDIIEVRYV